jgi:hypothetical protein
MAMVGDGGHWWAMVQVDRSSSPSPVVGWFGAWVGASLFRDEVFLEQGGGIFGVQGFHGGTSSFLFYCISFFSRSVWHRFGLWSRIHGVVGCEPMAGDPEPHVGLSSGLPMVNPSYLGFYSDIWPALGIHSSIHLSYSGGLDFSSALVY